jgi:hypothetical protein
LVRKGARDRRGGLVLQRIDRLRRRVDFQMLHDADRALEDGHVFVSGLKK